MDPRARGLGALAPLPDECIDYLLRGLGARELAALACASRVLRIFACEEPLWLELHLARTKQAFQYRVGGWRAKADHQLGGGDRRQLEDSHDSPLGFSTPRRAPGGPPTWRATPPVAGPAAPPRTCARRPRCPASPPSSSTSERDREEGGGGGIDSVLPVVPAGA